MRKDVCWDGGSCRGAETGQEEFVAGKERCRGKFSILDPLEILI